MVQGSATVTTASAFSGSRSVALTFNVNSAKISRAFNQEVGANITYIDTFIRPSIDEVIGQSTLIDAEGSRIGFLNVDALGHILALDGDGVGGGTWVDTGQVVALNLSGQATSWVRITVRQNYSINKWDLYVDGSMVGHDLGNRDHTKTYFSLFALTSASLADAYFDDFYIAEDNPLFVDSDNDGIDDSWESTHGLNTSSDDRNDDLDGDGLNNLEEYIHNADPEDSDSDGDGLRDGIEVALGTDPLVADLGNAPGQISGMILHLKADAGATTDGSGNVSSWLDQAQGLTATQGSSGNRPAFVSNVLNGLPVVRFDGSSSYLDLPHFMAGLSSAEVFVVLKASSSFNSDARIFSGFGSGGGTSFPSSSGQIRDGFGIGTTSTFGAGGADLSQPRLYNTSISSGTWQARLDGHLLYAGSGIVNFSNGFFTPLMGADHSGAYYSLASWFGGDIAEIIIYDHAVSPAERQAIGSYLTAKYALSVSSPSDPSNLSVAALSSSSVSLSWTGGGGTDYQVERASSASGWTVIATLSDRTSFTEADLSASTTYSYRVRAVNYAGVSSLAGPVSATTFTSDIVDQISTTGIRLWLKPEDLVQSTGGLQKWSDNGGSDNHAIQEALSNRPLVVVNSLGGYPAVHFDGANSYMNLPHFMSGATEAEVFVVLKGSATPGAIMLSHVGQSAGGLYYPNGTDQIRDAFGSTSSYTFGADGADLTDGHVYSVVAKSGSWSAALDGNILHSSGSNTVDFSNNMFNPLLGAAHGGAYYSLSNWFDGDVAEIIIYDHELSLMERFAIGTYLNRKYVLGISAAPAPTDLAASTISPTKISLSWNTSASSIYILERSAAGGPWTQAAVIGGETSYTDSGLSVLTNYSYRLKAVNFGGASSYTATASAITLDAGEMQELPTSGLKLWLKPEALLASSGGMNFWADESGNSNHATQTNPGDRPMVAVSAINGQPAVEFNGTSSFMDLTNFLGSATSAEFFVVLRGSTTSGSCLFSYLGSSGPTLYPGTSGQISDGFGSTSSYSFSSIGKDLTLTHLYSVSAQSGGWWAYLDGAVAKESASNSVNLANSMFTPLLGAARGGAYYSKSNLFEGEISEILIYDRTLTALERESVNFYLNQRYRFSGQNFNSLNSFEYDSDRDGASNAYETLAGSNPYKTDTDGDGMPDGWEIAHGLSVLVADGATDADGDGIQNVSEYLAGTDPQIIEANDAAASVQLKIFQPSQR